MKSFVMLCITLLFSFSLAFAEELTMTTYYPAPSGKYQDLSAMGNVGIGTMTPGAVLPPGSTIPPADLSDVFGHSTAPSRIVEIQSIVEDCLGGGRCAGDVGLFLRRSDHLVGLDLWSDSGSGPALIDSRWYSSGIPSSGGFLLRTHTASSPDIVNALRIDGAGNVGIGTTMPQRKLVVQQDSAGTPTMLALYNPNMTENNGAVLSFRMNGGGQTFKEVATITSIFNHGLYATGKLIFDVTDGLTWSSMVLDPNGNVGIGSTIPAQKLDLIGSMRLENTTSATMGVIYKGADSFIHDFQSLTGGTVVPIGQNLFIGKDAGNFTMGNTATITDHGSWNIGIGYQALYANTTGYRNNAIGYGALWSNTQGHDNVAVGYMDLYANTGGMNNVAMGVSALMSNTTGSNNVAVGCNALLSNTEGDMNNAIGTLALYNSTGSNNNAIGYGALYENTTGGSNNALGKHALFHNTTGGFNDAVGQEALWSNTTGSYNNAVGFQALHDNTTGIMNIAIGRKALADKITGDNNIAIGFVAGSYARNPLGALNTHSTSSIFIGEGTQPHASGEMNQIVIGSWATGAGSDSVVLGNDAITKTILNGNVGVSSGIGAQSSALARLCYQMILWGDGLTVGSPSYYGWIDGWRIQGGRSTNCVDVSHYGTGMVVEVDVNSKVRCASIVLKPCEGDPLP